MERRLYGVFAGSKFGMTLKRVEAVAMAKREKGEVRSIAFVGSERAYDGPTFYAISDPLPNGDFRESATATIESGRKGGECGSAYDASVSEQLADSLCDECVNLQDYAYIAYNRIGDDHAASAISGKVLTDMRNLRAKYNEVGRLLEKLESSVGIAPIQLSLLDA